MIYKLIVASTCGILLLTSRARGQESSLVQTPIFSAGQDGYHSYRIPSLLVSAKGTLLAFCEGRKKSSSDTGDIDLVLKRSLDGGKSWQPLQVVWDDGPNTCGNPCAVVDRATGAIWLLMTHNLGQDNEAQIVAGTSKGPRSVWVSKSTDDGASWSKPVEITRDVKRPDWTWYATGPGVGIQTRAGRLVIPCDHKVAGTKVRGSHVIYSNDQGATWKLGGAVAPDCNECQVVELSDGRLLLNIRSYRKERRRLIAHSKDGGLTWSDPVPDPALIEPVCQASIIRYPGEKNLILFANPASTKREKMTVRLSRDDARTWPVAKELHAGPAAYSCLAALPDGAVACLYEAGRKNPYETITFARFPLAWLEGASAAVPAPPVRIASGVSGHIHPAACVTRAGDVLAIFSQSDFKDLCLSRSADGGETWSTPVPFEHTASLAIYPGSLTTLEDGRVIHAWNRWYQNDAGAKSRYVEYSVSLDGGKTWGAPQSLARNPKAESIIRHAIVELGPSAWLFSLSDRTIVYDPVKQTETPFGDGRTHGLVPIVRTPRGTLYPSGEDTSAPARRGGRANRGHMSRPTICWEWGWRDARVPKAERAGGCRHHVGLGRQGMPAIVGRI